MSDDATMRAMDRAYAEEEKRRRMPEQKPGRSKQDYGTPADFIAAVEKRFGPITFDLAADVSNAKAERFWCEEEDSLSDVCDWTDRKLGLVRWLNPPFGHIAPWAAKCRRFKETRPTPHKNADVILFLVPASVGANWYAESVHEVAHVIFLNGRLSFDGKNPYPKDTLLAVYGEPPGFEVWRWK